MISLPIDPLLPEIIETLRSHRALVLVAPPGSGKTLLARAMVEEERVQTGVPSRRR